VLKANSVDRDAYIRAAVSAKNPGDLFDLATPALTVSVTPSGRKKWLATGAGMKLAVSSWQRPPETVFPNAAKNISAYAGPRIAAVEARAQGFDNCVLTTAEGLISEAPTATVFLVENGQLVTPRISDCALPGVTREWVLSTAAELGLVALEEAVTPDRLRGADEGFLAGTGIEFGPVRQVDDRELPGWPSMPVATTVFDTYFRQMRGEAQPTSFRWHPTTQSGAA